MIPAARFLRSKPLRSPKNEEITIYTIAIGDPEAVGEEKLDIETSTKDGGTDWWKHIFMLITGKNWNRFISNSINWNRNNLKASHIGPKRPLFHWPLALFVILMLGYHWLNAVGSLREKQRKSGVHGVMEYFEHFSEHERLNTPIWTSNSSMFSSRP